MNYLVRHSVACVMMTVITVCAVKITARVNNLLEELRQETKIRTEVIQKLPYVVENQLIAARGEMVRELRLTRGESVQVVREGMAVLDARMASVQEMVGQEVVRVGDGAERLMGRYERVPDDVAWATMQIWDCEGNPNCLENRYVSVSKAVEAASRSVEREVPKVAKAMGRVAEVAEVEAPKFVEHSAAVAENVNRLTKPKWYDRVVKYAVLGLAALRGF